MSVKARRHRNKFVIELHHGGRTKHLTSHPGPKRKAEQFARELDEEWRRGRFELLTEEIDGFTLSEYAKGRLEAWSQRLRRSTMRSYQTIWKTHLEPALGSMPLKAIGRRDVLALHRQLTEVKGLSDKRAQNVTSLLRRLFDEALDEELIPYNPASQLRRPRRGRTSSERQEAALALDLNQARLLLATVAEQAIEPWELPAVALGLLGGLRAGEVRGTQWQDVCWGTPEDTQSRYLLIRRQVVEVGFIEESTKSGKVGRIPLVLPLREILEHHWLREMEAGRGRPEDWALCTPEGRFLPERTIQKRLRRLLNLAGLPSLRFHDLRHTHLSLMLNVAGAPPHAVQKQARHADYRFTVSRYGHVPEQAGWVYAEALADDLARTNKDDTRTEEGGTMTEEDRGLQLQQLASPNMVEAGGIEPPSEEVPPRHLHVCPVYLEFRRPGRPTGRDAAQAASRLNLRTTPGPSAPAGSSTSVV